MAVAKISDLPAASTPTGSELFEIVQSSVNSKLTLTQLAGNPTAMIGLSAINGTSPLLMRADAAPQLDVGISPTWTGTHTFDNAITVSGSGSTFTGLLTLNAPGASGSTLSVSGASASNIISITATDSSSHAIKILDGGINGTQLLISTNNTQSIISSSNNPSSASLLLNANGSIILGSGSNTRLTIDNTGAWNINGSSPTAGSSGQVLTSNGSGTAPSWQAAFNGALTSTYVGYGSGSNILTGTSDFTWTDGTQTLGFGTGTTTITGANGVSTGTVGSLTLNGGTIAGTTGGGSVLISAGGSSNGGNVSVTAGNGLDAGAGGGNVIITAGTAFSSGVPNENITLNGGSIALQIGSVAALTVNASSAVGFGSSPSYGTSGQFLISQGSTSSPIWHPLSSTDVTTALGYTPVNRTGDTMSGTLTFSSGTVTGITTPVNSNDAATKAYVDAKVNGLSWKQAVKASTTVSLSGTYVGSPTFTLTNNGTQAALTVDSYTANVGDRILVKNQSTASQNGIYQVTNAGSVSTNWVLTRTADFNEITPIDEVNGAAVYINQGTINSNSQWTVTSTVVTFDSDPITWGQIGSTTSGVSSITPGTGISINQSTGAVTITNTGVTSVGLTDASTTAIYTISNTPVTTTGTLTLTLKTQAANTSLMGPVSGSAAQPTFRALVTADFPTTTVTAGSYTSANITVDATGRITAAANGTIPLTAGFVGYGSTGNVLTGTSNFAWTNSTNTLTLIGVTANPATITGGTQSVSGTSPPLNIIGTSGTGAGGITGGHVNITGGTSTAGSTGGNINLASGSGTTNGSITFNSNTTLLWTINPSGALGLGTSPAFGTTGQLLTSGGSSALPTWTTVASTGTDISVSNVGGTITINDTSTLSSITGRGATTSTGVSFTGGVTASQLTMNGGLLFNTATVAAAGTTQGTATSLTADTNFVTSGTGGVSLPSIGVGREITVINRTGSAINVYPASGGAIDGASINAAISVPSNGWLTVIVQVAGASAIYYTVDPVTAAGTGISVTQSNNGTITIAGVTFTSTLAGIVPLSGGGTTNFLRADGTWAAPGGGGGTPGGSNTQVQFNNSGSFGGDAGFTYVGSTTQTITLGTATTGPSINATAGSSTGTTFAINGSNSGGTTQAGGPINITAGTGGSTTGAGGAITISSGSNSGASGAASSGAVTIQSGTPATTGNSGNITIQSGPGGATSGTAGNITIQCGTPISGNGSSITLTASNAINSGTIGGNINLTAGNGVTSTSSAGGNITLQAGSTNGPGGATENNGEVRIVGGTNNGSGSNGQGGSVRITGGPAGASTDNAGSVIITGGSGGTVANGVSGTVTISGGPGGATSNNGAAVNLNGGTGGTTSGTGGAVNINGGTVTSGVGGSVSLTGAAGIGPNSSTSNGNGGGGISLQGGVGTAGTGTTTNNSGPGGGITLTGGNAGAVSGTATGNNGGNLTLQGGNATGGAAGGNISLTAGNTAFNPGGNISLTAGSVLSGASAVPGGSITLTAAAGATGTSSTINSGGGGSVSIFAGSAGSISGGASGSNGGNITLAAGASSGTAGGGFVQITGGNTAFASGTAGGIQLTGGQSLLSGVAAGTVTIAGGSGGTVGNGGNLTFTSGAGGSTSGTPGNITVTAGSASGASTVGGTVSITGGASTGGVGGVISITGGASAAANGAAVSFKGGNSTGGNGNGGNVTIASGVKNGTGGNGSVLIGVGNSTVISITALGQVTITPVTGASSPALTVNSVNGHSTSIGDALGTLYKAGYLEEPVIAEIANYSLQMVDSGKTIYFTSASTATQLTVPYNAVVGYAPGTIIDVVNDSSVSISIIVSALGTTDIIAWNNAGTIVTITGGSGSRTLAPGGWVRLKKVAIQRWYIAAIGFDGALT